MNVSMSRTFSCVGAVALGQSGCESDPPGIITASGGSNAGGNNTGGTFFSASGGANVGGGGPCVNLECQQVDCPGSATTTVSGTIYDPSGTLPLYNIGVYVPNAPLDPISDTLSCDDCDATFSGDPLVSALTDTHGVFVLENVPVGANIPLVIQVGKWRREITIDNVAECVDNPLSDPQVTRLPKSMAEGNMPKIALSRTMISQR